MTADIIGVDDLVIQYDDWTPGDIKIFNIDNSKIQDHLGIEFVKDFEKGLRLTIEWATEYFKR
jgi:UDP-glucose 4-epimerase